VTDVRTKEEPVPIGSGNEETRCRFARGGTMAVQGVKKNISGLIKSVSLFLTIFTTIILVAGVALPVNAANTTATPTHTVTPIITVTPISTTATPTATSTTQLARGSVSAGFSGNIVEGPAPLAVQFTDQSTGGPDTWIWSFGDGTTGTSQNPLHTYLYTGTYGVTLTVRNPSGATNTFFADNYITATNPVTGTTTATTTVTTTGTTTTATTVTDTVFAGFSGTPVTGLSPLYVDFTDSSTGSLASWYWDFGDGSQSKLEKPPQHKYSVPGTYTVSLTVTGTGGDTNVKKLENYITVTDLSTTTRTTAPVTSSGSTGATPTSATNPPNSGRPIPVVPTGQTGEMEVIYFMITGIIATIVVVAVILYKGAGTRRDEK
jgi:PKD repeat protein